MSNSETTIDTGRRKQARVSTTRATGKREVATASPAKNAGAKPMSRVSQAQVAADPENAAPSGFGEALQWQRMVAEAAYFRAERRGFVGGSPEQDWFEAEVELRGARNETWA